MSSYQAPQDLRRALADRARRRARAEGTNPHALTTRFYLHRLLARIFDDDPDGWILKGGQALLVRYPRTRHSRDLDVFYQRGHSAQALEEAVKAVIRAAHRSADDHVRFEYYATSQQVQERPMRQVRFSAYLGAKPVGVVSVDVVTGLVPVGQPTTRSLEPLLDLDLSWPLVRLWPLADQVADKICAMYEYHPAPSGRVHDLVDLAVIALTDEIVGQEAHLAIRNECRRRQALGTRIELPPRFTVPERTSWEPGYRKAARGVAGLEQYRTLGEVEILAERFVTPLLAGGVPARWHPDRLEWA